MWRLFTLLFRLPHPTLTVESILVSSLEQQRARDARAAAPSGEVEGCVPLLVLSTRAGPSKEQRTHKVLVPTPIIHTTPSNQPRGRRQFRLQEELVNVRSPWAGLFKRGRSNQVALTIIHCL